jgi:hypothetical protein
VKNGLTVGQALEMGIVNKSFDDFERQLVSDLIAIPHARHAFRRRYI